MPFHTGLIAAWTTALAIATTGAAGQDKVEPLKVLRVVTSAAKDDIAYASVSALAKGSTRMLRSDPSIRVLEKDTDAAMGTEALGLLNAKQADIAVIEMSSIADKPILRYAQQPFLSKDIGAARRLDHWMRRDVRKVLSQDLRLVLLGAFPQGPKVLVGPLSSWNGSFSNLAIFVRSKQEAEEFARLGVLNVRPAAESEIAKRTAAAGLALAVLPLSAALRAVQQEPRLRFYDQRVAYPVMAAVASIDWIKQLHETQRRAIFTLAKGVEDTSWARANGDAQRAIDAAAERIKSGALQPAVSESYSRLLASSLAVNASRSVSEVTQAFVKREQAELAASGEQQTYGKKCRNLEILLVTNRVLRPAPPGNPPVTLPKRGDELLGEVDQTIRFGVIKVQVSGHGWNPKPTLGDCNDWRGQPITDRGFELHEVRLVPEPEFQKKLQASAFGFAKDAGFLVFVHGYRTNFRDAVEMIARLSVRIRHLRRPVLVTWPSSGELLDYEDDGDRAAKSTPLVTTAIGTLEVVKPARRIDVVAHSMGNRVTLAGLRALAAAGSARSGLLHELVTVAPDVQCERYVDLLKTLQSLGAGGKPMFHRATLYLYENDYALRWSQRYYWIYKNSSERCRMGNQRGPAASGLGLLESVDWSCLKEIADSHSYFVESDYIAHDLRDAVAKGSMPVDRDLERIDVQQRGHYFLHPSAVIRNCPPPS